MQRALKIALITLASVLALALAAITGLVLFLDPNDYRDDIERVVEQRTGRELAIDGRIELSVFPWLGAEIGQAALGNAPGFGPVPFARVTTADLRVRLLPLLGGELKVGKVVLHEAEVNLARNAEGRTNWTDLTSEPEKGGTAAEATDKPTSGTAAGAERSTLTLGGLEVRDSRIAWRDGVTGARYTATDLDLSSGTVAAGEPFPVHLRAQLTSTSPELEGSIRLEGRATAEPGLSRYRLDIAELATDLTGPGLPTGSLKATLASDLWADLEAGEAALEDFDLRAYGLRTQGSLTATGIGDVPALEGELRAATPDGDELADLLDALAPGLRWRPGALTDSHLTARITGDLGPDSLTLERLEGSLLGLELTGTAELRRPQEGAVVSAELDGRLADGGRLLSPLAGNLPSNLKPQALEGSELTIDARLDGGENRGRLERLRLTTLGTVLSANANVTDLDGSPEATGGVSAAPFSPRRLLADLGLEVPATDDPDALEKAALDTAFRASPDSASLTELTLTLDDSRLTGSAAVPSFEGPQVRFDLALNRLNADRYLAPATDNDGSGTATPDGQGGTGAPGKAAASGASPLPMDLLRSLTLNGELSAGHLQVQDLRLSQLRARMEGSDGRFRIHPLSARLYGGRYQGDIRLDARGDRPEVALDEHLTGIEVGALLTDLTGQAPVTGTADVTADLAFRGTQSQAILSSLNGKGTYTLRNGTIAGVDLGRALAAAYAATGRGGEAGTADGTRFREIEGSVTVDGGKIRSDDLALRSGILDADGRGYLHLAAGRVDYRLDTTVGTGAAAAIEELEGLSVPMRIRGPITDPGVEVDLEQALRDRAQDALEEEKEQAGDKVEEALEKKKEELEEKAKDLLDF